MSAMKKDTIESGFEQNYYEATALIYHTKETFMDKRDR